MLFVRSIFYNLSRVEFVPLNSQKTQTTEFSLQKLDYLSQQINVELSSLYAVNDPFLAFLTVFLFKIDKPVCFTTQCKNRPVTETTDVIYIIMHQADDVCYPQSIVCVISIVACSMAQRQAKNIKRFYSQESKKFNSRYEKCSLFSFLRSWIMSHSDTFPAQVQTVYS